MKTFQRIFERLLMLVLIVLIGCTSTNTEEALDPVDYVNPYIGNISHLLVPTFPTVQLPNSMLRLIPSRHDYTTELMHGLPLVTTSHRGSSAFNLSAIAGAKDQLKPVYDYTWDQERITPYSWEVYLDNYQVAVDYGVSHQAGLYYLDFEEEGAKYLLVNNRKGEMSVNGNICSGYQVVSNGVTNNTTKVYLYLESEQVPEMSGILEGGDIVEKATESGEDCCVAFAYGEDVEQIKVRYGISFISEEQAQKNLYRELDHYEMSKLHLYGRESWNESLGKIEVEGGSQDDKIIFYTSLYRTYERPVNISEDGRYFSAFDGNIHEDQGESFYTDDWIWDTYRATHPLRVLIEKELEVDILRSFVRMAEQMDNFWMPTFPEITGDSRRMNSNHGVVTVLDAHRKGLEGFDVEKAYEACKGAITEKTLAPWSGKPAGELDRFFKEHGYFPARTPGAREMHPEVHHFERRQPVAVTLGTVYDEWCLSQLAGELGKTEEHDHFFKRSFNYRTLFNHETAFFHPRDEFGEFISPFDYKFSGGMGAREYYGENNAWVYRWDVPHNVADLITLMGGRESFIQHLDRTFTEELGRSKYAFYAQLPDHTGNVGQFSMANEPSLHIPYLYNYAGAPWKTQKCIRKMIGQWFRNDLMGVPGDEDGGGMSAFVVFSQLGFYPVTPGSPTYNIGSPFFERATIDLGGGSSFTIIARNVSEENKYIQSATLNGEPWNRPWFSHEDIVGGGELILNMGDRANREWGSAEQDAPPSAGKFEEEL